MYGASHCFDGYLFATLEEEEAVASACASDGPYGRRLDEYTASTTISDYTQAFNLNNDERSVGVEMGVTWDVTAGSAAWGYKSIKDSSTGASVENVAVTDTSTGLPLTFETYINSGGYTIVKFWFASTL